MGPAPGSFAIRFFLFGQVTGSNSVNVYLGIGIPWLAAAIYWSSGVRASGLVAPTEAFFLRKKRREGGI